MKTKIIFSFLSIIYLLAACKSTNDRIPAFEIDPQLEDLIAQKTHLTNGVPMGTMELELYQNDRLLNLDYVHKEFEHLLMTSCTDNRVIIFGHLGMFAGLGYQIDIFDDSCIVRHAVNSDAEIYKLKQTDSLTFGILVPSRTSKLTLTKKPEFREGAIISGMIELESEDYYEMSNGKENKYRVKIKAYFSTGPLQIAEKPDQDIEHE